MASHEAADLRLDPLPGNKGAYPVGITVSIRVEVKDGWEIDEWFGEVHGVVGPTAKIDMDQDQTVVVILKRSQRNTAPE